MEYILNYDRYYDTEVIDFDIYLPYVESIREHLPAHVYAFASNHDYFNLESPSSLHDAWLETLTVSESATGERSQIRKLEIHLCLLGPCHDRWIHLHYSGVTQYSFQTPAKYNDPRYEDTAHGDLFTHEIRIGHDGLLLHEILFERGTTLLIECKDIRHYEDILPGNNYSKHQL